MSKGAADLFADACKIEEERALNASRHIVSHLLREVEGAVIGTLEATPEVAQALAKEAEGKEDPTTAASAVCGFCRLPCRRCQNTDKSKKIEAILGAYSLADDQNAAKWRSFDKERGSWVSEAHRRDVWSPRRLDPDFEEKFERFVDIVEAVLRTVERNFPNGVLAAADGIIAGGPEQVGSLVRFLGTGATASRHVFERLDSQWLPALRARKAFRDPPELEDEADPMEPFPDWPQADYLVRMASFSPGAAKLVADIVIDDIPRTTNQFIHQTLLFAATKMPAADAARVAQHEAEWLRTNRWINAGLPNAVRNLTVHLLTHGQIEASIVLLRASLSFTSSETEREGRIGPQPRIPSFDYDRMVRGTISELVKAARPKARMLLMELILDVLHVDPSHNRPAIEDNHDRGFGHPLDSLLDELRDCYIGEIQDGSLDLPQAVRQLEEPEQPILSRLALHLLRLYGDKSPDLVVERATDQEWLDSEEKFHELREMIAAQFPSLGADDQSKLIEAFRENASIPHLFRLLGSAKIDIEPYARRHLRDLFAVIGTSRPPTVDAEYVALCGEFGVREHPTFHSWPFQLRRGPNSPKGRDELLAMTDGDLITYLRGWMPEGKEEFEPSLEGLARQIQQCAVADPSRLSLLARKFCAIEPTCVGALLSGLHEAARSILSRQDGDAANVEMPSTLPSIDWASVICLADWAIGEVRAGAGRLDILAAWRWARSALLDIAVDAVLSASSDSRAKLGCWAWGIVRVLADDPDPTPERISTAQGDDVGFSINTVRGCASEAAILIAHAVSKCGPIGQGLSREILVEVERRTDAGVEPSSAIRRTTARWMNHLVDTDVETAGRIADRLFPQDGAHGLDECGAWRLFVRSSHACRPVFDVLRSHYLRAVARAGNDDPQAVQDLGRHVAWLAVWGVIGPGSADGIFDSFVQNAPSAARKAALDDVGRGLYREQEVVAVESVARLKAIWERWFLHSSSRAEEEREDLAAFGWWFASSIFEPNWALPELSRVLTATGGRIEMHIEVVSKLAKLASQFSDQAAGCIEKFIGQRDQWRVKACKDALRSAISALKLTPAAGAANGIASTLVARGWMDFRDLVAARV